MVLEPGRKRTKVTAADILCRAAFVLTLFFFILAALIVVLGLFGDEQAGAATTRSTVVRVTDGDTIVTDAGKVRLLAIDTPEVYFHEECGGREASAAMKRLLHPGDRVRLRSDSTQPDTDRYGRLLRYVFKTKPGYNDVGRTLVRNGWAEVYWAFPTPKSRIYAQDQVVARCNHRGVWGLCGGFES
jgi:micrococcal nuclease